MADQFEFELVFALPGRDYDPLELSNAVFEAGFEDLLVGTGVPGLLGVELEADGKDAESAILTSARALLKHLPTGTQLREVRPDLVSLADVAEKLNVKRQALQQREMPLPSVGGLYRIDELATALEKATGLDRQIRDEGRRLRTQDHRNQRRSTQDICRHRPGAALGKRLSQLRKMSPS